MSRILSTGRSTSVHAGIPPPLPTPHQAGTPPGTRQAPLPRPGRHTPPDQATPDQAGSPQSRACWEIRSTSRQYASYWNAILLVKKINVPSPGVQILSLSCSFWEILAKSYVGAPWRVGAPTSEKSWICH